MPIAVRAPSATPFTAPSASWLGGVWHVTHSSLPMWESKRNVRITYTLLPATTAMPEGETDRIDDLVEYQGLTGDSVSTVKGVDKLVGEGEWHWRGKGWLSIASSSWQILGWGEEEGGWAVTFFDKTMFTPAGVDVIARSKQGLSEAVIAEIKTAFAGVDNEQVKTLGAQLLVVKSD